MLPENHYEFNIFPPLRLLFTLISPSRRLSVIYGNFYIRGFPSSLSSLFSGGERGEAESVGGDGNFLGHN